MRISRFSDRRDRIKSLLRIHHTVWARSGLVSGLAIWLLLAAGVTVVAAHAGLADSDPPNGALLDEPPEQVSLTFTQELDAAGSTLAIFDQNEQQVDLGDGGVDPNDLDHQTMIASLPSSLANGTYTVEWTAVSAEDGDTTDGAFAFTVGQDAAASETAAEPGGSSSTLIIGAVIAAALILLVPVVFVARRRMKLPVQG